jgi:TolA-binding protein
VALLFGLTSAGLKKLRPVTFKYKGDPQNVRQYGLVAEEVNQLYPELVTHGTDGKAETVRYSMLTSMLLNELQKQTKENERQAHQLEQESEQLQRQAKQLSRQAELIKRLAVQESEDKGQREAFEARFAILEQATQTQNETRNLTAAFKVANRDSQYSERRILLPGWERARRKALRCWSIGPTSGLLKQLPPDREIDSLSVDRR